MAASEKATGPELFFALVYPVGTDADRVIDVLSGSLREVGYEPWPLHLIDLMIETQDQDVYKRYSSRMDSGNKLREDLKREDAFALYCASQILKERNQAFRELPLDKRVSARRAYIVRSLKRPEEVTTLRAIYGDALIVVAAHSPRQARSDRLTWEIARSGTAADTADAHRPRAEELIARDEREAGDQFGQRVSDTFPLADVFVDASHPTKLANTINRFVELLFGNPFHTPTRAEYGMFHAQGAALRSADLSRQVGAAVTNEDGEILSLGTNEVPKGTGGLYWEGGSEDDRRDFTYGYDVSTEMKKRALRQLVERLGDQGWLSKSAAQISEDAWLAVQGTDLMNVGEFGRGVHAEMAAVVDAARRGVSINDSILYTTTFPCHVCARHIVASGIRKVVYNEPYPKSLARFLHMDSIAIDREPQSSQQLSFVPFVGVAPHLYVRLFRMERDARRTNTGEVVHWQKPGALPRLSGNPLLYIRQETEALRVLTEQSQSDDKASDPVLRADS